MLRRRSRKRKLLRDALKQCQALHTVKRSHGCACCAECTNATPFCFLKCILPRLTRAPSIGGLPIRDGAVLSSNTPALRLGSLKSDERPRSNHLNQILVVAIYKNVQPVSNFFIAFIVRSMLTFLENYYNIQYGSCF